jgi:AAA+ superfamily predicted ATPase
MSIALADLRDALNGAPDNQIMRMMLVRRLVDDGELSEALGLAVDLSPAEVPAAGDRAVLAKLFRSAGLASRAEAFADGAPETAPEAPVDETPVTPSPAQTGGLRVVGGQEADTTPPEATPALGFGDVGGLEQVKKDIRRRIILPFAQPNLVARFRKTAGGGVLLYGPPGCGKTLLARATAGECGARFLNAPLSEILHPHPGESERRLSALFNKAREDRPTVLFFDEIEALAAKRSNASHSHVGQLISHFLTEFDGIDSDNSGVLILAATNTPWAIDPAFLRGGRFDRLFFVPPPDRPARASIFDLELAGRPGADALKADQFAAKTAGLSGADIRAIVDMATDDAIDVTLDTGKEQPITPKMIDGAIDGFASSVGDWLATAKDYATYANESGRYDDVLDFLANHGRK